MEPCTVETGLLRKAPCGQTAVAKCANCEQPLCSKHAIPQLSPAGKKTGEFMCAECDKARREHEKLAAVARPAASAAKPAAVAKPAAAPVKPAAAPAAKPAAAPMPKDSPATQPSGRKELSLEDSQPLEFTPSKKPEEKK